jgi:hypothetical protein
LFGQKPTFQDYLCAPSSGFHGNAGDDLEYHETLKDEHTSSPEILASNQTMMPGKNPKTFTQISFCSHLSIKTSTLHDSKTEFYVVLLIT